MSIAYGDSSALAKLYLQEIGSSWMRALAQPSPGHLLHTSELTAHITEATRLVERYGLHGYDAIHLAVAAHLARDRAAQGLSGITFISADQEQLRAAQAEGLPTDDPNLHP